MKRMDNLVLKYENIKEFFYEHTSQRVKIKKEKIGLTNKEICGYKVDWVKTQEEYIDFTYQGEDQEAKFEKRYIKNGVKILDEKIVSRILNNNKAEYKNRASPNPFLIPPGYVEPLVNNLKFNDAREMMFGEEWELEIICGKLFKVILDTLEHHEEYNYLIETLLNDYVRYSQNRAYRDNIVNYLLDKGFSTELIEGLSSNLSFELLEHIEEQFPYLHDVFFEIIYILDVYELIDVDQSTYILNILKKAKNEELDSFTYEMYEESFQNQFEEIMTSITIEFIIKFSNLSIFLSDYKNEAIGRLFLQIKTQFINLYKDYFFKLKNFKSLDKHVVVFIEEKFIPFIKDNFDFKTFKEISLGHRVDTIMRTDLAQLSMNLSTINNKVAETHIELIKASMDYIKKLKHYQYIYDKALYSSNDHEDAQWHYFNTFKADWNQLYCEKTRI